MFTHLQFAQLASAAWAGPALLEYSGELSTICTLGGTAHRPTFGVSYFVACPASLAAPYGWQHVGTSGVGCPFAAITQAVGKWASVASAAAAFSGCAHTAAVVQQVVAHAAAAVRRAQFAISGQCPECGEEADPAGLCACEYVPVAEAHYFNV